MHPLPAAVVVTGWLAAWLEGRVSADEAIDGLGAPTGAPLFRGPEPGEAATTAIFLGNLRRWQVRRVTAALPVPGDLVGLGGPAAFNLDAIESTEAIVLHGCGLGMFRPSTGDAVSWALQPAEPPPYLPTVREAREQLRLALNVAADRLAELDVASWRPEIADALLDLRSTRGRSAVPYASTEAAALAHDAGQARRIVALAADDDGGALTAAEALTRAELLRPLDRAARAGLVAAVSWPAGR